MLAKLQASRLRLLYGARGQAAPGEMQMLLEPILGKHAAGRTLIIDFGGARPVTGTFDHADKRALYLRCVPSAASGGAEGTSTLVAIPSEQLRRSTIAVPDAPPDLFLLNEAGHLKSLAKYEQACDDATACDPPNNSAVFVEVAEYSARRTAFVVLRAVLIVGAWAAIALGAFCYRYSRNIMATVNDLTEQASNVLSNVSGIVSSTQSKWSWLLGAPKKTVESKPADTAESDPPAADASSKGWFWGYMKPLW